MALSGVLWDDQVVPSPHLTSQIECATLSKGMLGLDDTDARVHQTCSEYSACSASLHGDSILIVVLVEPVFLKYTVNTR